MGLATPMGYTKRFVKVDIPKKYSDATFRIILFFTVKLAPGANNYMLGCLENDTLAYTKCTSRKMDMRSDPRQPAKMNSAVLGL